MYVRERNLCQSGKLKFKVLAPSRQEVPKSVTHDVLSGREHSEVMFDVQKLRGRAYREYAAIASTLLPDGRHWQRLDAGSWHIVLQDADNDVVGCARYRRISIFDELMCRRGVMAMSPETGPIFKAAFEQQVAHARKRGLHYGEAGGWALSEQARCSTAAVNIALMSFALAEWLGGGLGLTTATTRHHSSSILRRIGGIPVAGFKPYYEPMFGCDVELLQFDIDNLAPRYSVKLEDMRAQLRCTPILSPFDAKEDIVGQVPHYFTGANQPAQPGVSQMH
jgi:hypothetical protein